MGKQGKGEKKKWEIPISGKRRNRDKQPLQGSRESPHVYFPSGHPKSPLHVVDQCWWEQALTRGGCFKLCPPLIN